MPSKSPAQAKYMRAVAHGWKSDRGKAPPVSVAKEFAAADKAKGYGLGGSVASLLEDLKREQDPSYNPLTEKYGTEPLTGKQAIKRTGKSGIAGSLAAMTELMAAGWVPGTGGPNIDFKSTTWYPSESTLGFGDPAGGLGQPGGYQIPRPPSPGAEAEPGSIAADIYEKYGITDPTATRYDLTSQDRLREDPLAHLEPDDPARIEYEGFEAQREAAAARDLGSLYPEHTEARKSSPYRQQLREHKARIKDILSPNRGRVQPGGSGGMVPGREMIPGMALGGLLTVMQNPEERGKLKRRGGAGMRPIIPQLDKGGNEAMMREGIDLAPGYQMGGLAQFGGGRMPYGRGRGPQRIPRGGMQSQLQSQRGSMGRRGSPQMRAAMQRPQMRGPMKQLGRPGAGGRVQPGGPGGMPGGRGRMIGGMGAQLGRQRGATREDMIKPADARMPGGRAMPYRGMLQKMQGQQRRPGGNRIGTGDQQGGLARAMQTQTGRPPISRRFAFPGRAR